MRSQNDIRIFQNLTNNPMFNCQEVDLIEEDDDYLGNSVFSNSEDEDEYIQKAYETLGITIATQNTLTNTEIHTSKIIDSERKQIVTPQPLQCDKEIMCCLRAEETILPQPLKCDKETMCVMVEEPEQPLKCDMETQCNFVLETADLSEIVKLCANLDTKDYGKFCDLITVCRNIVNPVKKAVKTSENELSKHGNSFAQEMEVDNCVSSKFRPSRHSISPEFNSEECSEENQIVLSKPVEHVPEPDLKQCSNSKITSKRESRRSFKNLTQKKPLNKKLTKEANDKKQYDSDNSASILRRSTRTRKAANTFNYEEPSKSNKRYSHLLKRLNDKQSTKKTNIKYQCRQSKTAKELITDYIENLPPGQVIVSSEDNVFKKPSRKLSKAKSKKNKPLEDAIEPLNKQIRRSLARNFLNKTYNSQLDELKKGPMDNPKNQFMSFQNQKKQLYSPEFWLDLYETKECIENKRQTQIFNN